MKKALIDVRIGDIHFGALEAQELYHELDEEFFNRLKKLPRIDIIFIQGDVYHYDLSLNSDHAHYSFKFWDKLYKIARKKQCKYIRIIKGTKSHDHNQLNNVIMDNDIDVKVINTVESEVLFDNYNILYLPEEYVKDPEEYYSEYFNDTYDTIVGHGMFEEVSFHNYNSEISMEAAPIYNSKQLLSICTGPITFGHIHNGVTFKKRIFYTGSFTRWCHGEEDPKGFLINITDLENKNFKIIPCENKLARKYITRTIDKQISNMTSEEVIQNIEKYILENNIYKFKLIVNAKSDNEFMGKVSSIQNYFSKNRLIELSLKNDLVIDDSDEENNMNKIIDKYAYLYNNNISEEDKISKFIKDRFDYILPSERINQLLTCDILKLLDDMSSQE